MRAIQLAVVCVAVTMAGQLQAAPITFEWSDTVSPTSILPTGVSVGDPFTMTITVDNGGTSTASQTWTGADFVSVAINVNAGAYTGGASNVTQSFGTFQTDALSNIIVVPARWEAYPGNGTDSNGLTGIDWFINGINGVWLRHTESDMNIHANNVSGNINPANWTIGSAAPVPEPTSIALLATGALGFMGYGWRRKRKLAA